MARKKTEVVAKHGEMDEGEVRAFTVGDTDLLLSFYNGEYHAVGAHCTHYGAPLIEGHVDGRQIVCPWHHAVFDRIDGRNLEPPARDCLEVFEVSLDEEGAISVTVPRDAEESRLPEMVTRKLGEDPRRFIIVGDGAAGSAAAEELRRVGYKGRIYLVGAEEALPYDRVQLSKGFLAGRTDEEKLPLRPENFYRRNGIDLLLGHRVTSIDAYARRVSFEGGKTREFDRLLLATGSTPRKLDVPGADKDGVETLRSRADAEAIVARLDDEEAAVERVVVVGSSFIGMEAAASMATRGVHVEIVSPDTEPFEGALGPEIGRYFREMHQKRGVSFHLQHTVEKFEGDDAVEAVVLDDGTTLEADLVLVGIGVEPSAPELRGVVRRDDGSIEVDARMYASNDVWVAGDLAAFPDPRTGELTRIEHWRLAEQLGRAAARAMADAEPERELAGDGAGVPFFWTRQYDTSLKYVGHASSWDAIEIDGSIAKGDFIAYYVADGQVLAAAGTRADALTALQALMRQETDLPLARVRDQISAAA